MEQNFITISIKAIDSWQVLAVMAEGTKDYKLLKLMLQESDQRWERDLARIEGKLEAALEEIKSLIHRMSLQNNEIMNQLAKAEIKKLRQIGPLQDYVSAFEMLLDRVHLREEQALNCFLTRLEYELEKMVRMFNLKTLQAAYSLAKLQDFLKNDSAIIGIMSGKRFPSKINEGSSITPLLQPGGGTCSTSNALTTKGNIVVTGGSKVATSTSKSTDGPAYKENTSNTTSKRLLNLTRKKLEEKKLKIQCLWYVYRLKKLMVLIENLVYCLCLIICLQLWKQWQFYISHGRVFQLSREGSFYFPLRTKDLRGEDLL